MENRGVFYRVALTLIGLYSFFPLSGCVAFQVGGEIQSGRMALLYGDPHVALAHFQRAAELNPDYLYNFSLLNQGVWTYVGRASYAAGKWAEAREALERARSRYEQDHLAKLYLGLVLGRQQERGRGLAEIQIGLKGLGDWLDYIDQYHPDGRFWDPGKRLRSEIQRTLAVIGGRDFNWLELIAGGEWLGLEFEKEVDLARWHKAWEQRRDNKRRGLIHHGKGEGARQRRSS